MPCCALAAFIFGQVVLGFDALKRFVLRRPAAEPIRANPATEWSLFSSSNGLLAAKAPRPRRLSFRWLMVASALEIALAAGAVYGLRAHHAHAHEPGRAVAESPRSALFN
jgi:hypothetical protein